MTGLARIWARGDKKYLQGILYIISSILFVSFINCGQTADEGSLIDRLPPGLKVVSVYGERNFEVGTEKGTVLFTGWESDAPQTIFLTDGEKTYLTAYILPAELVKDVYGEQGLAKLSHFISSERVKIDERTTALTLVMVAPPYFWMFTPRAIVFAAGKIIEHPKFEELVQKIRQVEPGELFEPDKNPDVFALASKIAEDVREQIFPVEKLTAAYRASRIAPMDGDSQESITDICSYGGFASKIGKFEDKPGLDVAFKVKHLIYYGGAVFNGPDPSKTSNIARYFVLKAQDSKVDLSLDNILTLNIINPEVETVITVPTPDRHAIRLEKGVELSLSIITDPVKRVGLFANFGRIVKYAIEIAVPNVAACIPDGYVWGSIVAALQKPDQDNFTQNIRNILTSSWDVLIRNIVTALTNQGSWIYNLLSKVGLAGCAYSPNFIISQIAALIRNFPIVKLYDAFTKYIPFGWELFTRPKAGVFLAAFGAPMPLERPLLFDLQPREASSPGRINVQTVGPECGGRCSLRIYCPNFGAFDVSVYIRCGEFIPIDIPPNFYGDDCKAMVIYRQTQNEGCPPLIGCIPIVAPGTPYVYEIVTSEYSLKITNNPNWWNVEGPDERKPMGEQGGGCATTPPQSPYHVFALAVILMLKAIRKRGTRRR